VNFEEARAEYARLRQDYDRRALDADEFVRRVQALQVRDDGGGYWAVDGATGDWLRYDGSAWVPGEPPVAQPGADGLPQGVGGASDRTGEPPATRQGDDGQARSAATELAPGDQPTVAITMPSGGRSPAAAGHAAHAAPVGAQPPAQREQPGEQETLVGFAPPPGPTADRQMVREAPSRPAPPPPAPAKRSRLPIVLGCVALALVALLILGVVVVVAYRGIDRRTGPVNLVIASGIDGSKPVAPTREFALGGEVYIVFDAKNMKQGQTVTMKVTRDGTPVTFQGDSNVFTFDKSQSYNGNHFRYKPAAKGSYEVGLYVDDAATASQSDTFTVK
jgi:hypothetical protein